MSEDLVRVESAVSATASGNLTWEKWPYDVATALGLAGRRNPLGFAMVRFLDSPSRYSAQEVQLHVSTWLIARGADKAQANEAAWAALDFWSDQHCRRCEGRGVVGKHDQSCVSCNGSGMRDFNDKPALIRDGISHLIEAHQWLEGQIGARMRR